jgi:hypothetical protein
LPGGEDELFRETSGKFKVLKFGDHKGSYISFFYIGEIGTEEDDSISIIFASSPNLFILRLASLYFLVLLCHFTAALAPFYKYPTSSKS